MNEEKISPTIRTELDPELSIRGESIQRIYNFYVSEKLVVNRKYQRKLVWNVEEKQKFVDSIVKNYPVPLLLLAIVEYDEKERYEIIDGMQRLNAISAFIEQEYGLIIEHEDGEEKEWFFNLDTMADTKLLKDEGTIEQRLPMLDRATCNSIAGYLLPLSVYRMDTSGEIDEIFRRINSGGRQLSFQEVRQSSSISGFADTVRVIASKVRGDDSNSDTLLLNDMKKISVSNKRLQHYGINVDDIFWVKQGILSREKMRQSNDEEIVSDILGSMILYPERFTSNTSLLDNMYGIYSPDSPKQHDRYLKIENELSKDTEGWINKFIKVYDTIRDVMNESESSFNLLVNPNSTSRFSPKHFQTIFLALYETIVVDRKVLADTKLLAKMFKDAGRVMNISSGAYSGVNKQTNISSVKGVFSSAFRERKSDEENPAIDRWTTKLENILMQSYTEQDLYDFKQGTHSLDNSGEFNLVLLEKIVMTLTAMSNIGKKVTGYVIIGVADDDADAASIENFYSKKLDTEYKSIKYSNFQITGVNGEVDSKYGGDYDKYMKRITEAIKNMPVEKGFLSNIRYWLIKYFDKALVVFEVKSGDSPSSFKDGFYLRKDSNTVRVDVRDYSYLFKKFN